MGSQSNLLVFIAVMVVAAAAYFGFNLFTEKRAEGTRNAMMNQLGSLGKEAVSYYYKPPQLGGGGQSFLGYQNVKITKAKKPNPKRPVVENELLETLDAIYSVLTVDKDSVVIEGVGFYKGNDKINPIRIRAYVKKSSVRHEVIN